MLGDVFGEGFIGDLESLRHPFVFETDYRLIALDIYDDWPLDVSIARLAREQVHLHFRDSAPTLLLGNGGCLQGVPAVEFICQAYRAPLRALHLT